MAETQQKSEYNVQVNCPSTDGAYPADCSRLLLYCVCVKGMECVCHTRHTHVVYVHCVVWFSTVIDLCRPCV